MPKLADQCQPASQVVIAQSTWAFFYIGLEVIDGVRVLMMAGARRFADQANKTLAVLAKESRQNLRANSFK